MDTTAPHTRTRRYSRASRAALTLVAAAGALMGGSHAAWATHFRYGHINWRHVNFSPTPGPNNRTIEYTVQAAWRQDAVTTGGYRCVNPASFTNQATPLTTVACTGPLISGQRNPGVGDVFVEGVGDVFLDFGDGNLAGGPGGDALLFKVTSENPANNWVFALAVDTNSLANGLSTVDTSIQHTYSSTGTKTARLNDCCRISPCTAPNAHMNNPDDNYIVQTTVPVGTGDSSPVSSLLPIVQCPINGICTFTVPASDNEVDALSFRMSTTAEAGFTSQPGSPQCGAGHAASISSAGVYTWNTNTCRVAGGGGTPPSGSCSSASLNTLYSTQVMIEEPAKGTKTAVDFFIQLVPACSLPNQPPVFDQSAPLCGSTISAGPGVPVSFTVHSTDPNAGNTVTLNAAGVPSGATLTPALPNTPVNPASTTLNWTPAIGDVGQHVITFSANDSCTQALCSITIDVSQENCTNGTDDDGDGLADCADPDCNGTPCNDGNNCTQNDTCHSQNPPATQCAGTAVTCTASDQCHDAGTCNLANGVCSNPAKNDGTTCNDGNGCTQTDTCQSGTCTGSNPLTCTASDQCHNVGTCDTATGMCSNPAKNNGTTCNDGNACTQTDTCQSGQCTGANPVVCTALDQCHVVGSCDTGTGSCSNPAQTNGVPCSDGLACTQSDTCQAGVCISGPLLNCSSVANQCNNASCVEPTGTCLVVPKIDGFGCEDGNSCTMNDRCQAGVCVGGTETGDSDGDGYCDAREIQAQCNLNDPQEIPPQPNLFSGGKTSRGEILLTFASPGDRTLIPASDISCALIGSCNATTHFCTAGKIGDPCSTGSDCNQLPETCRIVINYAALPDLVLLEAQLKSGRTKLDISPLFRPVTPGCSRKLDITLPPGFKFLGAKLRLKAAATSNGKIARDRDRIRYLK